MRNIVVLCVLVLVMAGACSKTFQAQPLEEGTWTGHLVSPTSEVFKVSYLVASDDGTQRITMEWSRGPTEIYDFHQKRDTLWFSWDMEFDFRLNCILLRVEQDHYRGACKGPFGSLGLLSMAPPGSTTSSDDLDPEAMITIWDAGSKPEAWVTETVEEPEPRGIDLDEAYAREALKGLPVDVGGHTLNLYQTGEGEVTVVLEAGSGDDLRVWSKVLQQDTLAARLVAYDRAGLGYSDPSPGSRTPERMATELHRLLRIAGIAPPFVLVGHAEGGFVIRRFASLYPGKVAGLVLVDPTHEEQGRRWQALSEKDWDDYLRRQETLLGILPGAFKAESEAFSKVLKEAQIPGLGALPEVPVVILTAMRPVEDPQWIGETPDGLRVKYELHKAWAEQAADGTHRVTETSGPYIHREEPDLVIEAIRQVLEAIREQ